VLAIVAPGQGSQTPGFLIPWLENSNLSDLISSWSEIIDLDLKHLGTTADADEIRETSNAQPLLVAAGLISAYALFDYNFEKVSLFAGHSVGEIAAASLAGVINPDDALKLVRARGLAMSKAAAGTNSGMAAVLGGDRAVVLEKLKSLQLTAANENGAGQIVAAGSMDQIERLLSDPPVGARVRPLAVSGAFHTSVMQPAVAVLAGVITKIEVVTSKVPVLSNKDGTALHDGKLIAARIVGQVANPVRWDLCMESISAMGITGVIEVSPAGTLVGLMKRAIPAIETFALKSPEDLAAGKEFVTKHGGV
jgi:[acyl-carrier-protein] S-malonyltransferase